MIGRNLLLLLTISLTLVTVVSAQDLPIPIQLGQAQADQVQSLKIESSERPHWVWGRDRVASEIELTHSFEIESPVVSMRIKMASVSARAALLLDGRAIATLEPYDPLVDQVIPMRLGTGLHRLTLNASKVAGPPGVFACLQLTMENGEQRFLVTDELWRASNSQDSDSNSQDSNAGASDLGEVETHLLIPADRSVRIKARDNYEQWKQALGDKPGPDPASFLLPAGFEIQLIRQAKPGEDSWVSLEFAPDGQLIIAKEKRGLLKMELSDDGNSVLRVESFADALQECRGLAFVQGDLYANANNSKTLYRLSATEAGFADPVPVFASSGGVGHGRNDLAVSPDGKLYSIHGDAVDLPTGEGVRDYTSPFRESRQGKLTREGHLLRIDPQSGQVELLAAGLRNPFGIDFNSAGEVFTYDADAEFDMGAPWYRPTRVSHLVVGGDYGWRGVTGNWPPYYPDHPDNARPNLDVGKGSPTAVKFCRGVRFPDRFKDALFILDWAYGRIIAVHLVPRGASYLMVAETFLQGRPLNVTDLGFAADGSLYLVTGGRQTQSAIYRVRWMGNTNPTQPASHSQRLLSPFQKSRQVHAGQSRQLRQALEAQLALPAGEQQLMLAWEHLGNPDPWISLAARHLLERQPISEWATRALVASNSRRFAQAMLALARAGETKWYRRIVQQLNERFPDLHDRDDRTAALYTFQLCLRDQNSIDDELRQSTVSVLDRAFPSVSTVDPSQIVDTNHRLAKQRIRTSCQTHNWLLSDLLLNLGHPDAVAKSIGLLNRAESQQDQMHYLHVLRRASEGWTIKHRRDYFSALNQARHYLVGAGMDGFLKRIREEATATLSNREQIALSDLLSVPSATGGTSPVESSSALPNRKFVREWNTSDFASVDGGDPERGEKIFAEATCSACHRFGSRGNLIGPDLTSAASRFNRKDMLSSILEPSKVIAESYQAVQVVTADGRSFTGLATMSGDYRSPQLRLATNPAAPLETIEIPKAEIAAQKSSSISWMPAGLLDHFSHQEIEDLLAYLRSNP
ncbi:MAG: c-type cytochrome [Rubripirellula sp.]|nr:c-type cytochrome [Rubripirellula sp.]